ncbi:MAG: hypothetical protein WC473_01130 [Patescibacteria group bacterium]|jgi:hypothetical protein
MTLILPSITTTSHADWRQMISDCTSLGVQEVALFLSALPAKEHEKVFEALKQSSVKSIPFVHLRSDMPPEEVDYLIDNYGTKMFNIHSQKQFPLKYDLSRFRSMIYLENTNSPIADEISEWAGLCLDVSHHENKRLLGLPLYREIVELLKKYPVGCWHLNAIKPESIVKIEDDDYGYDRHSFKNLSEFDYCVRYQEYLPQFIALELENTVAEQLKAKEYVAKLLKLK